MLLKIATNQSCSRPEPKRVTCYVFAETTHVVAVQSRFAFVVKFLTQLQSKFYRNQVR